MKRLLVTRTAFKDLLEIWNYIAADNLPAADRVRDELDQAMQKLCQTPGLGHSRADVPNPNYRFWRVYSYMIAYRVKSGTLYVSRVLHGARNFRAIFRK
jgi:toxin ParE1/3/4